VINNIDLFASFKASSSNAASARSAETSNGYSAEKSYSFKDSLKEAGRSINREDDRSTQKELVVRAQEKMSKNTKVDDKPGDEIEPKEKQTENITDRIEEILAMLQQLSSLQQNTELSPENQTTLAESIKEAFQELTALQSKLDKLTGAGNLKLQTEFSELQNNIEEFGAVLEEILEGLKAENKGSDSVGSSFMQKLQAVIEETMPKLEAISKTPMENGSIPAEGQEIDSVETAVMKTEVGKEAEQAQNAVGQEKAASESLEEGTAEAANKIVKKETGTETDGAEAAEEEVAALEDKTEKVTVQAKEDSKPGNESTSEREASKDIHAEAAVKQNKTPLEGMQAVNPEQMLPEDNAETAAVQTAAPRTQNLNRAEIINQIVKKAEVVLSDAHSEMRMQLEPENLGKLTLKIAVERGLITAKFTAESYEVKKVIESSLNELRDMLQEKGLEVQNFSVSVGQENKEYNNGNAFQQWKETVKLSSNIRSKGSYEGYLGGEADTARVLNPYSIHNGEFDHIA